MKFSIKYADKIIGVLVIVALGILVFVIFMLGSSQRWFSRDYQYKAYFPSASGLNANMPVQYKGFTIGHIKSVKLSDDDRVEVNFTIFDTYYDRVRKGSQVELIVSPIGLGGQFILYPGLGHELIDEGGVIPVVNSSEARQLIAQGYAVPPERDDSISIIIAQAGTLLDTLNVVLSDVQKAFEGTDSSTLGRTLGGLEVAVQDLPAGISRTLDELMGNLNPVLANLDELSSSLADNDGTIMSILNSEGPVYQDLTKTLDGLAGTLKNLEEISGFIPSQLPQLTSIIFQLNGALKTAEDLLVSLTNNPLLKGGVPKYNETTTGGTQPRDLTF
jgi:phospholipid/cholesterol/gamma-HCH transport system substrate-binding protein